MAGSETLLLSVVLDVGSTVGFYLLLPVLLGVLYLVAWKEWGNGERFGLARETFWLLLVGGSVGWVGNLPLFYWHGSVMALDLGGALIPIALSFYLLYRFVPDGSHRSTLLALGVWAEATLYSVELLSLKPDVWFSPILVYLAGLLVVGLCLGMYDSFRPGAGLAIGQYSILSAVTLFTFFTTFVVATTGIVSPFPVLLLPPLLAGSFSVLLLRESPAAPGLAYAMATLGGLVGADVLHQPALFAPGQGALLGSIGGAGPLDLVFLSGLLGICFALLFLRLFAILTRQTSTSPGSPKEEAPLSRALREFRQRNYASVPQAVLEGVEQEAQQTRRLLYFGRGIPGEENSKRLEGLPLNHPVLQDLHQVQRIGSGGPVDGRRAWKSLVTGFFLKQVLCEACRFRLAGPIERAKAFVLDLTLTLTPFVLLFAILYRSMGLNGWTDAFNSIPYEAVVYGAAAFPVVLFAGCELLYGATPGKALFGLEVRNRNLGRPGPVEALGRNVTKVLSTTSLAYTLGLAVPLALSGGSVGFLTAIVTVVGGIGAVLIVGWISMVMMSANPRRRRIGDWLVGTMVLRTERTERSLSPLRTTTPVLSGLG